MKSKSKIVKKNRRHNLGRYNRELVIRLIKKELYDKSMYHLVLARRRSRAGSRYDKLGYYQLSKTKCKELALFGINRKKIKDAIALGASVHVSVYKLLFN
jgi:ribosomal protein S16